MNNNSPLVRNLSALMLPCPHRDALLSALCLPKTQPGKTVILPDIVLPDYFDAPLFSNSGLKGGDGKMMASEATLRTGSLLHMAVYEPDVYHMQPEYQLFRQLVDDPANNKTIRLVNRMTTATKQNPIMASFLKKPGVQFEGYVTALLYGFIPFKVKLDAWDNTNPKKGRLNDLKSTSCKTLPDFIAKFDEYGYWTQAESYMEVTGAKEFYFVGVTKSEPHTTFTVSATRFKTKLADARKLTIARLTARIQQDPECLTRAYQFLLQQHLNRTLYGIQS